MQIEVTKEEIVNVARKMQLDTVFVLSGEATLKDLEESEVKPTFTLNGVWEIPVI